MNNLITSVFMMIPRLLYVPCIRTIAVSVTCCDFVSSKLSVNIAVNWLPSSYDQPGCEGVWCWRQLISLR